MITLKEMTDDELDHYHMFSYENFLAETAKSSGLTPEQIKKSNQEAPAEVIEELNKVDSWLVIKKDNQNIGYIWIQIYPEKHEAFGYDIFIEDSFRSQGIGREVMSKCSEIIRRHYNIEKVKICVFQNNLIARKLYESLGFQETKFDSERKQYTLELRI